MSTPSLSELPLGMAPAKGRDGLGQCFHFKGLMRNEIGSVDGAWVETVHRDGKVGLAVRYDPQTKGAEAWAKRAEQWADNVWERVVSNRVRGRAG
jgi:hypothetical protein